VKNLSAEGFTVANMVDIFDAGPVLRCKRDDVRTTRESRKSTVAAIVREGVESSTHIICNAHGDANFRACKGPIDLSATEKEGVTIPANIAKALKVTVGDPIRFVVMQAPGASPPSRSVVP